MIRFILAAIVTAALATSCNAGGSKEPTPVTVANVQQQAAQASARLTSGVVRVTGRVSEGATSVDFTIEYRSVADRLAYEAHSTFQGQESEVRVIAVPPYAWSLEDSVWKPLPAALPLDTFRARRIWSLLPFSSASQMGSEDVGGVQATRYHYEGDVRVSLPELAGSLIASGDAEFSGDLTHLEIDYWVDQRDGWPVKATYHASGDGDLQLTAELSQPNDAGISVEPPPLIVGGGGR